MYPLPLSLLTQPSTTLLTGFFLSSVPPKITSHLVIGTPGTIQGLIQQGKLSLDAIKIFVLDEADLMLHKQGLRTQTLRLKRYTPPPPHPHSSLNTHSLLQQQQPPSQRRRRVSDAVILSNI